MISPHAPSDQRSADPHHTLRSVQRAMMATLAALLFATPAKSDSCDINLFVSGDYEPTLADQLQILGATCPTQAALSHEGFASAATNLGSNAARARAAAATGDPVYGSGNGGQSGGNFSTTDFMISGPTSTVTADVFADLQIVSALSVDGDFSLSAGGVGVSFRINLQSNFIAAGCDLYATSFGSSGVRQRTCAGAFLSSCPSIDEAAGGAASVGCSTNQSVEAQVNLPVGEQFSIVIITNSVGDVFAAPGTASANSFVRGTLRDIQVPLGYTVTMADGSPLPVGGFDPVDAPSPAPAVPAMAAWGRFATVALMLIGSMIALHRRR